MPLYKFLPDGKTLQKVDRNEFANEEELHSLVENNLTTVLGVRLIAGEYPVPNGRIDTLGLDENGIPVVIEYKWKKDLSAIIQGLFYLDWVLQNKRPFESIVKDKLGKDVNVNWSTQPRLMVIAQDFDLKELAATNQVRPSIELIRYSLYEGLFTIDGVNVLESRSTPRGIQELEDDGPTVEDVIKHANPDVGQLFLELRDQILALSESVWEKVFPRYCDYRTISTFASVNVQKSRLKIFIKMGDKPINDPRSISKPVPASWGYGYMNTQFFLTKREDIDYALTLITQAYEYVSD